MPEKRPQFRLARIPAQASEHGVLAGSSEDGENPYGRAFPRVQDSKSSGVRLKRFSWQGSDGFNFAWECTVSQTNQVIEQSSAFFGGNVIEIALGPADQPQMLRDFASHSGTLSL